MPSSETIRARVTKRHSTKRKLHKHHLHLEHHSFAYGNYTLSAYAWPVPGETNTANNNFTDGWVVVTIPGDLNGDFKVNLVDLVMLANAYGSKPGDLNWNPNADLNGNGVIDLADLVTCAIHYGEQYSTQEQVRDAAMAYIGANHPETAQYMQNLNWTGGSTTPQGIVGAETYSYTSDGWNVTMQDPVVPNAIYSITANYTTPSPPAHTIVAWQGTWQNGTITETNYNFNP